MKRTAMTTALIAMLLMLPGCPEQGLVGSWILTIGTFQYGLELRANGEVVQFDVPPNNRTLSGILTWEMRGGDHFILFQDEPLIVSRLYSGAVLTDTTMSGVGFNWRGGGPPLVVEWSAVKVP